MNFYISDIWTGFVHIMKCLSGAMFQDAQTLIKKNIITQHLPKILNWNKNGMTLPEFLIGNLQNQLYCVRSIRWSVHTNVL